MTTSMLSITVILYFLGQSVQASDPADKIGWLEFVGHDVPAHLSRGIKEVWDAMAGLPQTITAERELKDFLEEKDKESGRLDESERLFTKGRTLTLGLQLEEAASVYIQAIETLKDSYVLIHNPDLLAQLWLYLGVNRSQAGKKEPAKDAFRRALAMVPDLELSSGYFSPRVRELFLEVRNHTGHRGPSVPEVSILARVCLVARLQGIIIVSRDVLADKEVLRWAWFDAEKQDFTRIEIMVVGDKDPAFSAHRISKQLIRSVPGQSAGMLHAEIAPGISKADSKDAAGEKAEPWYRKHWWVWPVAAVVVTVGIALPLAISKSDVAYLRVHH